jgi:hypothetical protein
MSGIFRKAAKGYFSFFRTGGAALLNVASIKRSRSMVSGVVDRARHRECPKCAEGLLRPFTFDDDATQRRFLGCEHCDYFQPEEIAGDDDVEAIQVMRTQADDMLSQYSPQEITNILRNHVVMSRCLYGVSFLALLYAFYLLLTDHAWSVILALTFFLAMALQGFKHAYHHWLVSKRRFFEPGAFRDFLAGGGWFV